MKISKQQKTMKAILKVKTQSFLDNYKKNLYYNKCCCYNIYNKVVVR